MMMHEVMTFLTQHWVLTTLFLVAFFALMVFEAYVQSGATKNLSPQMLVQAINQDGAVVIDVRNTDIFKNGHIINSINIPLTDLEKRIARLNVHKQKSIVVVCGEGQSPAPAVTRLTKKGFKLIRVLAGGIQAWRKEGLPLEKDN